MCKMSFHTKRCMSKITNKCKCKENNRKPDYLLLSVCLDFLCIVSPFEFLASNSHKSHFNKEEFFCSKTFTLFIASSTFLRLGSRSVNLNKSLSSVLSSSFSFSLSSSLSSSFSSSYPSSLTFPPSCLNNNMHMIRLDSLPNLQLGDSSCANMHISL